jgi:CheY-like chemotaxis protein
MQNENFDGSDARRWMVVDDTPAVLEAVAMLLESLGCAEIFRFNSAAEALEAFTAAPEAFEVIITDLDMPEMNGIEFCAAIRDISPWQKMILATGSSQITEREAMAHGFHGMLRKPFPIREMIAKLERAGVSTGREETATTFAKRAQESLAAFSTAWAVL